MPFTDREISLLTAIGSTTDPAGTPINRVGRLSTSSNVYADVAIWTVAALFTGDLHEVSMISDDLPSTEFRLEINAVEQFTDLLLQTALSIPWRGNRLVAGAVVRLQARSPDNATAIIADVSISGTERPV